MVIITKYCPYGGKTIGDLVELHSGMYFFTDDALQEAFERQKN